MNLTWIDFLLRLVPEGFFIMLAGYAVAKRKIDIKPYILSSLLGAVIVFGLKALPINPILPTILSMVAAVLILVFISKIKIIHSILSAIISLMLLLLTEIIGALFLQMVMGMDPNAVQQMSNRFLKILYNYPSLIIFALLVLFIYIIRTRKKKDSDVDTESHSD